jgi:hypothetical protein
MMSTRRVLAAGRVDARQLWRRRRALVLLTVLPLAFYAASSGHNPHAVVIGGIALAFSLAGAPIFASIAARAVDQRLVLTGYRPTELLLARLLVLEAYGAAVAVCFSAVMVAKSDPPRAGLLVAGVLLVGCGRRPVWVDAGRALAQRTRGRAGHDRRCRHRAHPRPDRPHRQAPAVLGPRQLLEGSLGDSNSGPHAIEPPSPTRRRYWH